MLSDQSVPLPPAPDALPSAAAGFAISTVTNATPARRPTGSSPRPQTGRNSDKDGQTAVRLYWTLTDPVAGPGEPLLLVNGLGSPLVAFEAGFVSQLLSRGFSVLRFDNRDVGRSDRVAEARGLDGPPYGLTDMAADAVAVLDAAGWSGAHVLGQSMGGMIAQQMAIDRPERLRSLTSLMSSTGEPGFGPPTNEAYPALVEPSPRDREAWLGNRVATERIWASPGSWDPEVTRAKGELLFDYGIDVDGAGRQFRAVVASGSRDEALANIDVPTLVIHGSADTLIQPSGGRHTAEVIPGARYVELEGFGHDLPADFWPVLADTLADFALS
ncbi:MAG: alpha/beta hydrolase [Acidimicrobiia bacterium]|nr:alpha/beta hydrolase [Acidimicrobiia bacterium]